MQKEITSTIITEQSIFRKTKHIANSQKYANTIAIENNNKFNYLIKRFDIIREKHKIIFRGSKNTSS